MRFDFRNKLFFALRLALPLALTVISAFYALLVTGDSGKVSAAALLLAGLTFAAWALFALAASAFEKKGDLRFFLIFWSIALGAYFVLFLLDLALPGALTVPALVLNLPVLSLSAGAELFDVQKAAGKLVLNLLPGAALLLIGVWCRNHRITLPKKAGKETKWKKNSASRR